MGKKFILLFSIFSTLCFAAFAQPAAPTISGSTSYCQGSTLMLTASSAAAAPTYNWTGPSGFSATSATINIPAVTTANNGVYSVTVTSGGLTSTPSSVTVTIVNKPLPPAVDTSAVVYCQGNTAAALNATGANLLWYSSATAALGSAVTPIPATGVPGTFTYYVSQTVNGCESDRAMISVLVKSKPTPPAVNTINYCQGDIAIPLNAGGSKLLWYNTSSGGVGTPIAPTPGTSYPDTTYYFVSQTVNGCESDRAQLDVVVNYRPNAIILANEPYVCQHDTMSFNYYGNASATAAYNWTMPAGAQIIGGSGQGAIVARFDTAGSLTVLLQVDNHGCKSPVASYVIDVRQSPDVPLLLNRQACQGQVTNVATGVPNEPIDQYIWDFGGADVTYGASGAGPYGLRFNTQGTYVVKLTTVSKSCPSTTVADTIYVHPLPDARIQSASATYICSGDSVQFTLEAYNPAYLYQWSPQSFFGNETNQSSVFGFIDVSGYVKVTATSEYGCTAIDSVLVSTHACCEVQFPNAFTPNGDGRNDIFRPINQGRLQVKSFKVADRWGKIMYETTDNKQGWDGKYAGTPQDMGTYFYYIKYVCSDGKQYEQKGELMLIR